MCSKKHELNSLNNEAVAYSGAASIAFGQGHLEEATDLIGKAITLAKDNLVQEGDVPDAQSHRLNLAGFLLVAADAYLAANEFDVAFSACEEASKMAKDISVSELANRAKSELGAARTSECLITARRRDPVLASKYCDYALAILEPMKDVEGGKYQDGLARALLTRGMVKEDEQLWGEALSDFNQADSVWGDLLKQGQSQFKVSQATAAFYSVGAAFYAGDQQAAAENARRAVSLTEGLPSEFRDFRRQVLTEAASILDSVGDHAEASEFIRQRDQLISVPNP